ncbi:MAG: ATP synthase F1 subunit delta [Acidaminococcales bacterium]|jgi:F-type H+-transporting ATPase subunit delta|nr:ATP synthase F1 subunit delta [Acidaminococcales bacterium]
MLNTTHEIAGKYAQALFELAREEGSLPKVKEDIRFMAAVFAQNAQIGDFLENPFAERNARKNAIEEIFKAYVQPLSLKFILVLAEKRMEKLLPLVLKAFNSLLYEEEGIVEIRVTTARNLSESEYGLISEKLAAALKKPVMLERHVDKGIVGGMIVQIGDRLINGSVSKKLRDFSRLLDNINSDAKGAADAG